jgi:hypothetical protein
LAGVSPSILLARLDWRATGSSLGDDRIQPKSLTDNVDTEG